jgi:hypothetical protein
MVFFTIHSSTLEDITLRRAQGESKGAAFSDLRNNAIAQNFISHRARPGTQRDRPLMRPVTAPCDHDPPCRCSVGTRSLRLDPPDKASDRPLMRPVTVALSSHPGPETDLRPYPKDCPPFQGREERSGRRVPWPSGPSEHRDRGAKVRSRISGESEPPVRRASEVTECLRFRINSDEHDAEHGVRSGPDQPLAPEQRDKPGASSYQPDNPGKQGGDVSGAGASLRRRT